MELSMVSGQDFKRAGMSRLLKHVKGKGQVAVLAKKGQFASYKEKLEKTDRISLLLGLCNELMNRMAMNDQCSP
jgi:hypothetical protein